MSPPESSSVAPAVLGWAIVLGTAAVVDLALMRTGRESLSAAAWRLSARPEGRVLIAAVQAIAAHHFMLTPSRQRYLR